VRWLDRQLGDLHGRDGVPVVLLDPDDLVDDTTARSFGEPLIVTGYVQLRKAWEHDGRRGSSPRPVFVVRSPEFSDARSLPWDIEHHAALAVIRWPVPLEWRLTASALSPDLFDLLADLSASGYTGRALVVELLRQGFGVVLPAPSPAGELDAVIRVNASHLVPPAMWPLVRPLVSTPLALALCQSTPDYSPLQAAWADWLAAGDESTHAQTLRDAGGGLAALLASGLVQPAPVTAGGLPPWSRLGATQPGPDQRLEDLLSALPSAWMPKTPTEWVAAASWWGDVRAAAAEAAPAPLALVERAAELWRDLDDTFQLWLRTTYPTLFNSARPYPVTLDQVAPFLARRHASTGARQLLVLVDGMGFAQWSQLRRSIRIKVVDAAGCFALCPTLTSVSRQAVFAGAVPLAFADSLWTTRREESRWRTFWAGTDVRPGDIGYCRMTGAAAIDVPAIRGKTIAAVVVLAVDELMHGSDVLGDAQMSAGLEAWARHGFLETLVRQADGEGFEVWITADHGNIEATPSGRVMEGPLVDQAGTRVRLYDNTVLRDTARAEGIAWDPPGLPEGKAPLFAPGKTGYHSGGPRVTHGGLSVDEVIVPFVRVTSQ
jgi:hypothetical protein